MMIDFSFLLWHVIVPACLFIFAYMVENTFWKWKFYKPFSSWRASALQKLSKFGAKIINLKRVYIFFAVLIGFALLILFIALYYQLFNIISGKVKTTISTIDSNFALAFLGTVSSFGALFGVYLAIQRTDESKRQNTIAEETNKMTKWQNEIASRQAHTAEQESITERINKAIENLAKNQENGDPMLEVRLGTLYDLERIAKDSQRDHRQILEMLCGYIRLNSPVTNKIKELKIDTKRKPRKDIQTALTIIGRHDSWLKDDAPLKTEQDQRERGYMIDLSYCDLWGADIHNANLSYAMIQHANLNSASIHNTNMTSTNFYWTDMIGAFISESNLTTTGFSYSNLSRTHITNRSNLYNTQFSSTTMNNVILSSVKTRNVILMSANLEDADIIDSDLYRAEFYKANLKGVNTANSYIYKGNFLDNVNFTKKQLNNMFCGIDVEIPKHLEPRPKHWPIKELSKDDFMKAYSDWKREARIDSYADSKNMTVERL